MLLLQLLTLDYADFSLFGYNKLWLNWIFQEIDFVNIVRTPTFHKIRNCRIFSIFSYSRFDRQLYIFRIIVQFVTDKKWAQWLTW